MTSAGCKKELQTFLQQKPKECKAVVMPDFFLDRLINLEWDAAEFSGIISEVAKRKGGSVDGIPQTDMRGGNAINVASALSHLGVEVTPIVCTSEFGLQQIKYHFQNTPIDLSYVKISGQTLNNNSSRVQKQKWKNKRNAPRLGEAADLDPQT